uniref:Uncharacterized protein n=1 Tax=viral metagenome TaxID=1070528 RepID=A0A6C0CG29_9ZZZZ
MEIGVSDVKTFLRHPNVPRAVLEDVFQMLRIMLNKSADQVDSDQEMPATVVSAREQMYYDDDSSAPAGLSNVFPPGSAVAPMKSSLKEQAEAPIRGGNINPESATVKATYVSSDNYGDGYIELSDKSYEALMRATHTNCQQQGLYFPYGFGSGKNQLKIKKLNLGKLRKDITISLKFSRWEMNGKSGFSCYGEVSK